MIVIMIMFVVVVVMVVMIVAVVMVVIVIMPMIVAVMAVGAMLAIRLGADAFHVMMMAPLGETHLGLEAQHLGPVFAEAAVHQVLAGQGLLHPVGEGIQDQGMVL